MFLISDSYMYSSSSLILKFIVLFLYVNTLFLKGSILRILNSVIYFTVCLINPIPGSFAPLIQLFTQMVRLPVALFSWLLAVLTISRFSLRDICSYSLRLWWWVVCLHSFLPGSRGHLYTERLLTAFVSHLDDRSAVCKCCALVC